MKSFLIYLSLFMLLSFSQGACKKQRPQLPANKETKKDAEQKKNLEKLNQNLIFEEDSLLQKYADLLPDEFKKNELGFWYKIDRSDKGKTLKKGDFCHISYQTKLLDGTLVEEEKNKLVCIGKKEVIKGIDFALELLHKGETIDLIIPWNLAYGMQGKENSIPPYTSIRCSLKVEKE